MKRGYFTSMKSAIFVLFILAQTSICAQAHHEIDSLELPSVHLSDQIVRHAGYVLSYNEKYEQANWVAYQLTAEKTDKKYGRTNKFIPDPDVQTGSATQEDYNGAGYDRGHLAPAADMGWSEQTMAESFFFSNMSPQVPSFNRGIWKKLEEQVRDWAIDYHKIYIATGPVFSSDMSVIGVHHVAVPKYYYKVILDYNPPDIKAIGFILPNEASSESLQHFAVSVDSVEKMTHLDFFTRLQDQVEAQTEHRLCLECWSWDKPIRSEEHAAVKTVEHQEEHPVQHPSAHVLSVSTEAIQCRGITKKGTRCKKMTKDPSGFCNLHQ